MPLLLTPLNNDSCMLAYLYPSDKGIGIDDVIWINYDQPIDEVMFEIVNENEQIVEYSYSDDMKIYILIDGTNVYYSIRQDDLAEYINRYHNLFRVYIENNQIKTLINAYLP